MYPKNLSLNYPAIGFAVANDQAEEKALLALGYVDPNAPNDAPDLVGDVDELEPLRLELQSLGVKVDKRWKEDRLRAEIEKAK
jgi:hypothetical protein